MTSRAVLTEIYKISRKTRSPERVYRAMKYDMKSTSKLRRAQNVNTLMNKLHRINVPLRPVSKNYATTYPTPTKKPGS